MKKRWARLLAVFLCAVTAFPCILPGSITLADSEYNAEVFRASLCAMYSAYDNNSPDSKGTFALKRLVVFDTESDTCGACAVATDTKHGYRVLQYATEEEAKNAYDVFSDRGILAEADGVATLNAAKGEMYPAGSAAVGSSTFLSKYAMGADDVTVAVVDTGVMCDHKALSGRFVSRGYDYSADAAQDAYYDTSLTGDYYGHATFVCGVIADNTPDTVKLLPYKAVAFGASSAAFSAVVASVYDAVDRGANVINISLLTSSGASSYKKAIAYAVEHNVCVCTAAGNEGEEIENLYPAETPGAITVAALNSTMTNVASFSNYGECIDFCAPGRNVISTFPYLTDSDDAYATKSGTSFSSPYIAALCADIKTMNSDMLKDDVYNMLCACAVDFAEDGYDIHAGNGMPCLAEMVFTDGENYTFSLPEGTLGVLSEKNYTKESLPWGCVAKNMVSAQLLPDVERIGDYTFYNMQNAALSLPRDVYLSVGKYAFYHTRLTSFTFDTQVESVGTGAFSETENFVLHGYRNTPAETYAQNENITFDVLGCRHNYLLESVDPTDTEEGYTVYTCSVCGDTYIGAYIAPTLLDSGTCGDGVTFAFYDTGKLTLAGEGSMEDYTETPPPWKAYVDQIKILDIRKGVETVCPFAFYGCTALSRITASETSQTLCSEDNALYTKDKSTLLLVAGNSGKTYTMPQEVRTFASTAFFCTGNAIPAFNDHFTLLGGVVYDADGNIIMALPTYQEDTLRIENNIQISDYAFLLTTAPSLLVADAKNITFGACSIGYSYDGTMTKNEMKICTYDGGTAHLYAQEHTFATQLYNKGDCGEEMQWEYDVSTKTLQLTGSGEMYAYAEQSALPWSKYMTQIYTASVDEDITALSDYAFYGASALTTLSMPISLGAPENNTVWYGCNRIRTLTLTHGSGVMDDYCNDTEDVFYYRFTPWYLSRNTITRFNFDENVTVVGKHAFRACAALKAITLHDCKEIKADAFCACGNLTSFTNEAKDTVFAPYSVMFVKVGSNYNIYNNTVLHGYTDSTARDYCDTYGVQFDSLGCGHSRTVTLLHTTAYPCCFDTVQEYHCFDCDEDYTEYTPPAVPGHYVKGTVRSVSGKALAGCTVCIDGAPCAVTGADGTFITDSILCGEHTLTVTENDLLCGSATLQVEQSNTCGEAEVLYGDLNGDGKVNGRDVAYAKIGGNKAYPSFDFGKTAPAECTLDTPYGVQALPQITQLYNTESDTYKRNFFVKTENESEYTVKEIGFIYGYQMDDDLLYPEHVGETNEAGYTVKCLAVPPSTSAILTYGASRQSGTVSVRVYLLYTNGVKDTYVFSEVSSYTYPE